MNLQNSKSTFELIKPIVEAIDNISTIDSVVDNSNGTYTILMCDTLWITTGFDIIINGNSYTVISFIPNVSVTISGSVLPIIGDFELYRPVFYHGTIAATEEVLNEKINNRLIAKDKFPMIWLHEPLPERISDNEDEAIIRNSDCEIYFVIDAAISIPQDDHYAYAIKPMRQLIDRFFAAMKLTGLINTALINYHDLLDLPRFGRYTLNSGAQKTIFSDYELDGTKLTVNLPFIRNSINCC